MDQHGFASPTRGLIHFRFRRIDMLEAPVITVLVGLLVVAVYTDLRVGKIYNKLTLPCIAFGMTMRAAAHGIGGLADSLCGAGLVLGLFALFAPKVGIGGGDTKLMMAVGALTGLRFAVWAMLASAIVGGVLAVAVAMRHRVLSKTIGDLAGRLYTSAMTGVPADDLSGPNPIRIPYSPAIALGSLVTLLAWTRFGPV